MVELVKEKKKNIANCNLIQPDTISVLSQLQNITDYMVLGFSQIVE